MTRSTTKAEDELRSFALTLPETWEDFPWGERVFKVGAKVFVFMGKHSENLRLSVKLPFSRAEALGHDFATPTGYGLGKHGWVSLDFAADVEPPLELLRRWVEESYRAVAPKKLIAQLDGEPAPTAKKPAAKKRKRATAARKK